MTAREAGRDPWAVGGVVLLALLTLGTVLLYRSGPQSVSEARSRGWVAMRPDAFGPRVGRAEERLRAAAASLQAGDTAAAMAAYATAAEEAWTARGHAESDAQRGEATELWARAVLDRVALMLHAAGTPWWRRDNDPLLREALTAVERVIATPTAPPTRVRAGELAEALRRKLRPGPLEWLPR